MREVRSGFSTWILLLVALPLTSGCANMDTAPMDARAYTLRGRAYWKTGQYDQAIAEYNKALEINPRLDLAYYGRGIAYGSKAEYDRAISDFTKAVEIDPRFALAYSLRGSAYWKTGQYDQAIADYTKALEIDPRTAAVGYVSRAIAHHGLKNYDKAWDDVRKAQDLGYKFDTEFLKEFLKNLREASGREK